MPWGYLFPNNSILMLIPIIIYYSSALLRIMATTMSIVVTVYLLTNVGILAILSKTEILHSDAVVVVSFSYCLLTNALWY